MADRFPSLQQSKCVLLSALVRSAELQFRCERWRRGSRGGGGGGVGVADLTALTARDCTCVLVQKSGYFGRTAGLNSRDLDLIRRLAVVGAKAGGVRARLLRVKEGKPFSFADEMLSVIAFPRFKGEKPLDILVVVSRKW